jgi:hypothetical protein
VRKLLYTPGQTFLQIFLLKDSSQVLEIFELRCEGKVGVKQGRSRRKGITGRGRGSGE